MGKKPVKTSRLGIQSNEVLRVIIIFCYTVTNKNEVPFMSEYIKTPWQRCIDADLQRIKILQKELTEIRERENYIKNDTTIKPISDIEKTARFVVRQTAAHLIRQLFR